jgi:hypothetical protein
MKIYMIHMFYVVCVWFSRSQESGAAFVILSCICIENIMKNVSEYCNYGACIINITVIFAITIYII